MQKIYAIVLITLEVNMSLKKEQIHERYLDKMMLEHGCQFMHEYNYRAKRLAYAYLSIQQLQARLNFLEQYHSEKLADVHDLWIEHKNILLAELKLLIKRKDYNQFQLASRKTLQSWRNYYMENRHVYQTIS